jgi:uncharacterized repeat protein (TIGR03806 family)
MRSIASHRPTFSLRNVVNPVSRGWLAAITCAALLALPLVAQPTTPAAPRGATHLARDAAGNQWALVRPDDASPGTLQVLPAQDPVRWHTPEITGLAPRRWTSLVAQDDGQLLVSDGKSTARFDPRQPATPATEVESPPSASSKASPWRLAATMPAPNHDLSAAVLGTRLYVAGGFTSHFGYPARPKAFDAVWELSTATWQWRSIARLTTPRIYCATVAFNGKVWVLGGDVLHADGERRPTTRVDVLDPETQRLRQGPDLPVALPAPLALVADGRLWVVGARSRTERGLMASIGKGDTTWRIEPEALPHMWALAGAVLHEKLYVVVPETGLAVFDPKSRHWEVIPSPSQPRSSQVAAWREEIWIMGGVDVPDWRDVHIFNPAERRWRRGPSLPLPLAWGAAAVVDDRMIVAGGAGLHGAGSGNYVFSDRTYVLDGDAYPASRDDPAAAAPRRRWTDERLRGTGESSLPFRSEQIFPQFKFDRLATVMPVPGGPDAPERLLVAEVHGPVWTFPNRPDVAQPDRMLDLPARFQRSTHTYALAFHPEYPKAPYVYVLYNRVEPKPAENVLARFTVDASGAPKVDWRTEQVILRWPSDGHNGGDVRFGPDGYLYLSTGDRGSPGDLKDMGQRVDVIAGGVLRLDVLRAPAGQPYSIPRDNPFIALPNVRPEFWAYGLRNPWRMWFGRDGLLWLGDNGDDSWESIHLIGRGNNYGWSVFEGSHPFKRHRQLAGPNPKLTPPAIELSHAEARSIIGGMQYQDSKHASLAGHHLFGDFVTGSVWAFEWNGAVQNYRRIAEGATGVIAFGTDRAGEILMARNDGQIHRLVAQPPSSGPSRSFPQRLSETGLFGDLSQHEPAPGVLPYEVQVGLWSDGAAARRMLALSGASPITIERGHEGRLLLPNGSAVTRTLELPTPTGPRRIETQVMYREQGSWRFYTYAWNEAQTEAELVDEAGDTRPVPGLPAREWRFAARSECAVCHTAQTQFTIGLTTAQLDRDADFSRSGGRVDNQLARLRDSGLLRAPAADEPVPPPKPSLNDERASPERRARAYLDVNCAHCHRAGGVGGRSSFQLVDTIPLEKTGLINGRPLVPLLGPDARIVSPGRPDRSELIHRLITEEGGRMPLIGSTKRDHEGIALVRRWIESMRPATP